MYVGSLENEKRGNMCFDELRKEGCNMIWYDFKWFDLIKYIIWCDFKWYDMIWKNMI